MAKGPQLTQRKIDKLRDALNVVLECDQVPETDRVILRQAAWFCRLTIVKKPRAVVSGYSAGPKKVSDLDPPPETKGLGA